MPATIEDLTSVTRAAFGDGRTLAAVERVTGGSKKGVYRLILDDATTAIAYLWTAAENYWPATDRDDDPADPFSSAGGLTYYTAARDRLESLGLRVPELYLLDEHRKIAVVEDFPGPTLQDRLAADPSAVAPTVERLADNLRVMRAARGPSHGKIALIDGGGTSHEPTCERSVLTAALRDLAEAARRDQRIAGAESRLHDRVHELFAAVEPRNELSVVHGELGFDHVLVDAAGEPVLIDTEGLLYFDAEWEHVFLRIRLHDDYRLVAADGLDERRLAFYLLAQRLSLTAGPLRLLDGDFPDRDFMRGIAEHNLRMALELRE